MPSTLVKPPWYLGAKFLNFNNSTGDAQVGGNLTTVPANTAPGGQGQQNIPGDRIVLGAADALALSDNTVGNLYGGIYQYVGSRNNSSSGPARGHALFWDLTANDALYQATSDNAANITINMFAGVAINNFTKGNWWWIQTAGKASLKFLSTITTAGAIGSGAYLATTGGSNNNNNAVDIGTFDTNLTAANSNGADIDKALRTYVGVQEVAASNNNITLVDMPFGRQFRW